MTQQSVSVHNNIATSQFVVLPTPALVFITGEGRRRGCDSLKTSGQVTRATLFPRTSRLAFFLCAWLIGSFQHAAAAPIVTLFTNQGPFVSATGATLIRLPAIDQTGFVLFYEDVAIKAPYAVVRDFGALGRGTIVYDVPPLYIASPTVPRTTAGFIAAHGEDDYDLSFDEPVCAVGLYLITNFAAQETLTVKDATGRTLYSGSIDSLTSPNALAFIGLKSTIPIKTVFLDTQFGGSQNEAIFEIWRQYCP